jgi:hypothetical protein
VISVSTEGIVWSAVTDARLATNNTSTEGTSRRAIPARKSLEEGHTNKPPQCPQCKGAAAVTVLPASLEPPTVKQIDREGREGQKTINGERHPITNI